MKITFVRTPRPKQFKYPSRYYDEEKERREQRKKELGLSPEKADFSSRVSANWRRVKQHDKQRQKKAKATVLIYLFIVAILVYFLFFV